MILHYKWNIFAPCSEFANIRIVMVKDILILGEIYSYTVAWFFDQITAAIEEDDEAKFNLRLNTTGGSPEYGMSIIEKVQEDIDQFDAVKVAGQAHSMGLFLLCYLPVEKVEVLDTTQAILHRPAWPDWIEKASDFKGSAYEASLVKCIKDVQKAFTNRVNIEALENLPQMKEKNLKVKDIFSMEERVEVLLSGADLKKIGIAGTVNTVTPKKAAEINATFDLFKNCKSLEEFRIAAKKVDSPETKKEDNSKPQIMNIQELKAQHPALYAEVFALGETSGAQKEQDRVGSITAFMTVDPEGVKAAIASGKPLTETQRSEWLLKASSADHLAKVKKDSEKEVQNAETKTEEQLKAEKIQSASEALDKQLGIKKSEAEKK